MPLTCAKLLELPGWAGAIGHPFLHRVADGTINASQFNTWLRQDRLFVQEFTKLAGVLLSRVDVKHLDLLLGGLGALKDELLWFEAKARDRGIDLSNEQLLPACDEYVGFMRSLHSAPLDVLATAFWAIERVYNQAWRAIAQAVRANAPAYVEFSDRWGSDGFTAYVEGLAALADEALAHASCACPEDGSEPDETTQASRAVEEVLRLEGGFWDMAFAPQQQ